MTDPEIFRALILANRILERIEPPPGLEAHLERVYEAWEAGEPMGEHVSKLMDLVNGKEGRNSR